MSTPDDVKRIAPLALSGAAELLETTVDRLPAGFLGLLENYGAACFEFGAQRAYNAKTIPYPEEETIKTDPPASAETPPLPDASSAFSRPTIQPPKGRKKPPPKLPAPPRVPKLPKGLKE